MTTDIQTTEGSSGKLVTNVAFALSLMQPALRIDGFGERSARGPTRRKSRLLILVRGQAEPKRESRETKPDLDDANRADGLKGQCCPQGSLADLRVARDGCGA